jgi:hypothetical protein
VLIKRKALALTVILGLLISAVAGTLLIQNGTRTVIVQAENSDSDTIVDGNTNANVTILSPENRTYNKNNVTLAFTIENDLQLAEITRGSGLPLFLRHGVVLDYDTSKLDTIINSYQYWNLPDNVPATLSASGNRYVGNATLTDLSQGPHNVTVWVRADQSMISYSIYLWAIFSTVSFNIDLSPPKISILSPQSKAYSASDVPLDFAVNEETSQLQYCSDGQNNVTITGNVTLFSLAGGAHNVKVYAWNEGGKVGASKTITFKVVDMSQTVLTIAIIVTVIVVGAGLLFYLKKRKH